MFNFYNILDDDIELSGFTFEFVSNFRVVDKDNGFFVEFHKLFKRSFKSFETQVDIITSSNISVTDINNLELDDFKINKLYKGTFFVNFYENNTFDIFLKNSDN